MQVFKSPLGRSVALGFSLALCMGFWSAGLADVVHFANGLSVRGKLDRVTGDIIEFRRSHHFFGNLDYFKRIQLTDRHDVVETREGNRYFGEIIYVDGLKVEVQTATGAVRINRMKITNVVLGSPLKPFEAPNMKQIPVGQDSPEQPAVEQPEVRGAYATTNISQTKAIQPGSPLPSEDEDVIPAVDGGQDE